MASTIYTTILDSLISILNYLIKMTTKTVIFDHKSLYIHHKLKLKHNAILKEFENNFQHYKLTNPGVFSSSFNETNNKYGYLFINYYGQTNTTNFPILSKLIENENIHTCFYSVIDGKKKIPTHTGPNAGLLRYHYTLYSPNLEKDYLKVNNKRLHWTEKDGFLFDDTYPHKLVKKSDGVRVSLIMDIKRPLPFYLDCLNRFVLNLIYTSPYVTNCRKQLALRPIGQ